MIINIQTFQYTNVVTLMRFKTRDYFYSNYSQEKESSVSSDIIFRLIPLMSPLQHQIADNNAVISILIKLCLLL